MSDLVIYGTPVSPFVRKVEAVLRREGVEYTSEAQERMASFILNGAQTRDGELHLDSVIQRL